MRLLDLLPFDDTCRRTPRRPGRTQAARAGLAGLALAVIAGCGGGGGDAGLPAASGGTSAALAYTQGTVTGFGSVIVNGVRFDDSSATVSDDNGSPAAPGALRLGMRVEVDSSAVDASTASATAHAVRFGAQLVGPVTAINTNAGTLTALGQVVDITATTVFDDSLSGGLGALALADVVEVHGVNDVATGHIVATRIEREASVSAYQLRGSVTALDPTAKTFFIGAAAISYAGVPAAGVPNTLADGVLLRVQLDPTPVAGVWTATSLGIKGHSLPVGATTAQVRGSVSAFTSATAFSVDGLPVDASAASFPDGSAGLALGVMVEVHGTVSNGVLVATKVELESQHQGDDNRRIELHGAITAVDSTAKTFVVRGVTVSYAGSVTYPNGSQAGLVVGAKVEVKGGVGSTRTLVQAVRIQFES